MDIGRDMAKHRGYWRREEKTWSSPMGFMSKEEITVPSRKGVVPISLSQGYDRRGGSRENRTQLGTSIIHLKDTPSMENQKVAGFRLKDSKHPISGGSHRNLLNGRTKVAGLRGICRAIVISGIHMVWRKRHVTTDEGVVAL